MRSTSEGSLRFRVEERGLSGATWELCHETNKNLSMSEVYLSCSEIGDRIHISMHASGKWRFGYERSYFQSDVKNLLTPNSDRAIEKWDRPPEIKPGITLALHIITPFSSIRIKRKKTEKEEINKIPNAPRGKCTEIFILFIKANKNFVLKNAYEVGSLSLTNGDKLVVAYHVTEMRLPTLTSEVSGQFLKGKSLRDLLDGEVSALIFGNTNMESRIIWDCAVRVGWGPRLKALWQSVVKS